MDDRFLDTLPEQKERARQFFKFSQYLYYLLAVIMLPAFLFSLSYRVLSEKFISKSWVRLVVSSCIFGFATLIIVKNPVVIAINLTPIKMLFQYFDLPFWDISTGIGEWVLGVFAGGGILVGFEHFLSWSDPIERKVVQEEKKTLLEGKEYQEKVQQVLKKREKEGDKDVFLGLDENGEAVILSDEELNQGVVVTATTGAGKTTTLKTMIESALEKNKPMIFTDGKGDKDFISILEGLCKKHNRRLRIFSTDGNREKYNPLSIGSPTELKDKLMTLTEWTEPHYELNAQRYLQLVFRVLELKKITPDMQVVSKYLFRNNLEKLIVEKENNPIDLETRQKLLNAIDDIDERAISGLASRIATITESDIGNLLTASDDAIQLWHCIKNKEVVLFSLDSLKYPDYARSLGKLIINDIKSVVSYHARHGAGYVLTIYDEFRVFATMQVLDTIDKARSAGFQAVLSFQSLASLDAIDETLRRQIIQNTNTHIIQRQNDPTDAQELAKVVGTKDSLETTWQRNDEGLTGTGMVKSVKEFVFHPDMIKHLRRGEAVVSRKHPEPKASFVRIREVV